MKSSQFANYANQRCKYLFFTLLLSGFCVPLSAEVLRVNVQDADQQGVANIVVYALSKGQAAQQTSVQTSTQSPQNLQDLAVMDQVNNQFVPHILVVERDSWVTFPNSDSIKHHVYSFSKAKPFELKLYDEGQHQPMQFQQQGEVALGCNIHDWMLGYIYVVDTPWFGKTAKSGEVSLTLPAGDYELKIWSPLLQGQDKEYSQDISVKGQTFTSVVLASALLPALSDYENSDELDDY